MNTDVSRGWPREYAAAALMLLKAADFAESEGKSAWDFAVELEDLQKLGLSKADLRWLVCRGWVDHAAEISAGGASERVFRPTGRLTFRQSSCFVLTGSGRAATLSTRSRESPLAVGNISPMPAPTRPTEPVDAIVALDLQARPNRNMIVPGSDRPQEAEEKPTWNQDRRELSFRGKVVKSYRVPSPNQEHILNAFQEEEWPEFIHDPLPPAGDMEPHRRLQATIKSLNRRQSNNLIRFRGNGGDRVFWEPVKP
jgi:hypothetical protein